MPSASQTKCSRREGTRNRSSEATTTTDTHKASVTGKIEGSSRIIAIKSDAETAEDGTMAGAGDGTIAEADKMADQITNADGNQTRRISDKITPKRKKPDNKKEYWETENLHPHLLFKTGS